MNEQAILAAASTVIFLVATLCFVRGRRRDKAANVPAAAREPKPGETWQNRKVSALGDPWLVSKHWTVSILDAKEGWIRYSMGSMFSDERMKASTFVDIYEPLDAPLAAPIGETP